MRDMVQVRRQGGKRYDQPNIRIGRSQFNRSHGLKTTFDANRLVPILVDEVYPGDTFTMSLNGFCRIFSPLEAPVMDNIELETFFFFVPNRLLWDNWARFLGEHDGSWAQDTAYVIPVIDDGLTVDHDNDYDAHGLAAFFGLPEGMTSDNHELNALPFRAYRLVYHEWFRDQTVEAHTGISTGDGPDAIASYPVEKSYKKHDYFTSCLPDAQKSDSATMPTITPLSGYAYVSTSQGEGNEIGIYNTSLSANRALDSDGARVDVSTTVPSDAQRLFVDLSTVNTGVDLNDLRYALAVQRMLEKDARGGTRLVEKIKEHFGVTVPDYTIQRPEFLGGGKAFINISPVANTREVPAADAIGSDDVYQGSLSGIGAGTISGHSWAKSFVEHGWVIGIVRARGDLTYYQGIDRMWTRSVPTDFYLPIYAGLGEQAVRNDELWNSETPATDAAAFGYQERWAELRYKKSLLVGNFNPELTGSFSHWHLAEDFATLPTLNQTFLNSATPMSRITAVDTEPDFIMDLWFNYKCARPLPVRSVPSIMGQRF